MFKRLIILGGVIGALVVMYMLPLGELDNKDLKVSSELLKAGDECEGIADNSTAHMTAIVEFQKLEIYGRKMNVIRRCMADHGFVENPEWLKMATPSAHAIAIKQNISFDEAIENLRRESMLDLNHSKSQPTYWKRRR